MKKSLSITSAIVLTAFGLLTFYLSTSVLFDLFDMRAKQGHYVPFIIWANLLSSLMYFIAAYGFAAKKAWTFQVLMSTFLLLIFAFLGLIIHINTDGIYEAKTVGALIFRISFTLVFTLLAYFLLKRTRKRLY
ncbi:MAG: hypothetical protein JW857_02935 [Bacteroidales bacterium]|nr:hypothetical protein [Bacteroidales bacterium]